MGTSPNPCCREGCLIVSDDFGPVPSNDPGSCWDQPSGSWSILCEGDEYQGYHSCRIREAGTKDALVIAKTAVDKMSFRVSADTPSVPANAKYRVIVNYVDEDNYHFAEFEFPPGGLRIALYKRAAGNDSLLREQVWLADMVSYEESFSVCFSEKVFSACQKYEPYEIWITDPEPHAEGYRAGLGNGKDGVPIEYGCFVFTESGDTNPNCLKCVCGCDDIPLPMDLTAKCTFVGDMAPCTNPVTVPLKARVPSPKYFDQAIWYGTAEVDCSNCPDPCGPFTLALFFHCGCWIPGGPGFWVEAELVFGGHACNDEAGTTCDPLYIPFDRIYGINYPCCQCEEMLQTDLDVEITR